MDKGHDLDQLQFFVDEVPQLMREDVEVRTADFLPHSREEERASWIRWTAAVSSPANRSTCSGASMAYQSWARSMSR